MGPAGAFSSPTSSPLPLLASTAAASASAANPFSSSAFLAGGSQTVNNWFPGSNSSRMTRARSELFAFPNTSVPNSHLASSSLLSSPSAGSSSFGLTPCGNSSTSAMGSLAGSVMQLSLQATCFSILYGPQCDLLEVMASSPDEANIWIAGITCLITGKRSGYGKHI
ncbi:unnamed protein product [Protopolystoma xenopodis]|uniref:PH domain-containing protein n=1 Tax=Protopolystoma xenopodis TaxID=117903 RepID=A0A3S5BPJ8_9PLAT|nr:unnamed protein product [Protopolystoma xenopodis]